MSLKADFYDEAYYDGGKGYTKYDYSGQYEDWADMIIERYHPTSVIDVGCAKGFLVKALHARDIAAWGVDVSKYAIDSAEPELRPYLIKMDITRGTLRSRFIPVDLAVSFDTLEHIPEDKLDDARRFLKALGSRWYIRVGTDKTPNWEHDKSHVTIKSLNWWKKWWPEADFEESK